MPEGRRPETAEQLEERRRQRRESRASQSYASFLKDLCEVGSMAPEFAEQAAVSVLCTLEQRLIPDEAKQLEAQLPLKLQSLLGRCERHEGKTPPVKLDREQFLELVGQHLNMKSDEVESIVRAVFLTIKDRVSEGEIDDVIHQLPKEFHDLWYREA